MTGQFLEITPEQRTLVEENALLREELAHLLTEEHDLVHLVKPNLLALYQKEIGAWELRGLQAQVAALRARRRLEMVQAALNQGGTPDLAEIDDFLELEFLIWQQKIQEAASRLEAATERLKLQLPTVEDRELKKLYYALVKKLHPDVNPELTEDQNRLWRQVQKAYEHGDLQELKALSLLAPTAAAPPSQTTFETLRHNREILQGQLAVLLRRIEDLESQPPFTFRAQLADDAWVARRRQEIETETARLEAQRAALEAQLQTLLPLTDHGPIFGLN